MPKAKKAADPKSVKKVAKKSEKTLKVKPKSKPKQKTLVKKLEAVKIDPIKKAKPVIIDVIEDEETDKFFPDLPAAKPLSKMQEIIEENESEDINTEDRQEVKESENVDSNLQDIDQQKKFFSKLVTEIQENGNGLANKIETDKTLDGDEKMASQKSLGLYSRLVWRFIAFTAILLVAVFYFSFSKLTITISPKGETINDSLLLKVKADGSVATNSETDFREDVPGTINEVSVAESKNFPASGEEFTGEEISGKVNIINTSNKAQALVAKTRLLSSDNKLFRIAEAVNVPAGGEVSVDIYVDKPSEDLAISATSFTIPGLWLGLQDKIYAKSTTAFVYRQKVVKFIKASDIEAANSEMNTLLLEKAKLEEAQGGKNDVVLYETVNPMNFETDAKAGDTKDEFNISASSSMAVISFSKIAAEKLTTAKLDLLVPDDKELVSYSPDNISYTLDSYDVKTGIATVKASFSGTMILKNDTEIIDKKTLVNLNKSQIENYLKAFPEINSYELKFFPSFITRAPRLPEKINIEIKGLEK
ncbi:MAG: hypothetical protein ACOYL8_04045 [Patescibacteria group bacterium]